MIKDAYNRILEQETTPEALEATVCYLVDQLRPFLKTPEPVLVCFPDEGPASLGGLYKEALHRCGARAESAWAVGSFLGKLRKLVKLGKLVLL